MGNLNLFILNIKMMNMYQPHALLNLKTVEIKVFGNDDTTCSKAPVGTGDYTTGKCKTIHGYGLEARDNGNGTATIDSKFCGSRSMVMAQYKNIPIRGQCFKPC